MLTKLKKNILFYNIYTEKRNHNKQKSRVDKVRSKGFTLVELMVVLSIVAILAALVMSSLNSSRQKAMDTQIKSDMSQVRNALELYATDNGYIYPTINLLAQSEHGSSTEIAQTGNLSGLNGSVMTSFISTKKAYATSRNQNCVYFDNLSSILSPKYIEKMPRHPLDDGEDACYKYFADSEGQLAVAYGPLITDKFDIGINKQVGVVVGKNDIESLKSICEDNVVVANTPFPLFSGTNHCSGSSIADEVIGVTSGEGQIEIAQVSYACSLPEYSTEQECTLDRSYCSDPSFRDQVSCISNGSYNNGYCSNTNYTDQASCEGAGYTTGGSCSASGYTDQASCEGAGYVSSYAYCSNPGYYDQASCVGAGYYSSSAYCSNSSYTDQASCVGAGYYSSSAYCSNPGYYDQASCIGAGYSTPSQCSNPSYTNQSACEGAGYYVDFYLCSNPSYTEQSACEGAGYVWSYGGQNFYSYNYTWTQGGFQSYGYTWTPAVWESYGYTWTPEQWQSYGYIWTPGTFQGYGYIWYRGDMTPNTWTSVPGGSWNQIN